MFVPLNILQLVTVTAHFLFSSLLWLFVCYSYSYNKGLLRVQTPLSHMQLTNKDSPEIADCVNTLRGDIIAFHVVEVTNVIQVDLRMILNCPKAGNRYNLSSSSPCPHFPTKYFLLTSLQSLQIPANLELLSYFNLTNELQASGCSSAWPLKYWTTASPELLEAVTMWNVRPCFLWQWKSVSAEWRTSVLWALS